MSLNQRKRSGNNNCCVVGYGNTYANTDKSVKFYSFPSAAHEKNRRELWIKCIKRETKDGKDWVPTKYSRICCTHFIGNERSGHPNNPAYVPTIFPGKVIRNGNCRSKMLRFQRALKRKQTSSQTSIPNHELVRNAALVHESVEVCLQTDASTQVNFESDCIGESFCFESTLTSNNASTYANIPKNENIFLSKSDKCVGSSEVLQNCDGFHGFNSISEEDGLNSLCGITFPIFSLLLSLLPPTHGNDKFDLRNKLLIFLIKIKCGLSYSALGVLFGTHRTTIMRIFINILTILVTKTQNYVRWPSRDIVFATQPKSFKLNYPNCRVIIDCTEIKIEQPQSVDNRIYTYSQYKSGFTLKFLVGITPNGLVSFVSKCYGGRSSDSYITNESGLLHLLEPGDVVLADKGFPGIKSKYRDEDVVVVLPPFLSDGRLTEEVHKTYDIASVRIHVERIIQRIKIYNILQKIPTELLPYADDIVFICCVLSNLQPPIFKLEN